MKEKGMRCPRCSGILPGPVMKKLTRSGVTIDKCPKCGGIWLDKDEIEKLLKKEKKVK